MKRVLIIFPDAHLPYSPTILNLAEKLSKRSDLTVLAFPSKQFGRLTNTYIHYLEIPFFINKIYGLVNRFSSVAGLKLLMQIKKYLVRQYLKKISFNEFIVTDPVSLWMIKGVVYNPIHLVSLELTHNTFYYLPKVNLKLTKSLVIQSKERKDALCEAYNKPIFYLQNAPDYLPELEEKQNAPKNRFVFSGTAFPWFGIYHCLEFLLHSPEVNLTIIGKVPENEKVRIEKDYQSLLNAGRLIIEHKYFEPYDMLKELAGFRIGFCFYDLSYAHINNVNYKTAPSGKMFAYFAAGVPVIGIKIPGLMPIEEFNAGILIEDLSPESIKQAVEKVELNYDQMVKGCFKAAKHFCYKTNVEPFISFVLN